jgi:hypothetical protein
MTDCAARGNDPERPAAKATISNAALEKDISHVYVQHRIPSYGPLSANHEDSGQSELEEKEAAFEIEYDSWLDSPPG